MDLKTYQAYTMAEALAAVKKDLGPSAVILNTRSMQRGGFLGFGKKTVVQVTATVQEPAETAPTPVNSARAAKKAPPKAALRAYRAAGKTPDENDRPVDMDTERLKTQRLAQALLEKHVRAKKAEEDAAAEAARRPAPEPKKRPRKRITEPKISSPPAEAPPVMGRRISTAPPVSEPESPAARRYILVDPEDEAPPEPAMSTEPAPFETEEGAERIEPVRVSTPSVAPPDRPMIEEPEAEAGAMRDELASIRRMVGEVLQRQVTTRQPASGAMPQCLFDMYLELIGQEVSEELADGIIADVRTALSLDQLDDPALVRTEVRRRLERLIPTADEPLPMATGDGRPLIIAMVGPTGVGKTTTLAKLAATFKLQHHQKVGLITADTYRIAAVDQLRTYANIIGLELKVALTPGEMKKAVQSMSRCDAILIDTAGRSQHDESRIAELKEFIAAADPHEVHLVLSSTAGEKVLLREAEAFSTVGVDRVVLTKLDEAVSFGTLINVTQQIGAKLSYFTTGQEVPDHIELGRPQRLAGLVLGEKLNP